MRVELAYGRSNLIVNLPVAADVLRPRFAILCKKAIQAIGNEKMVFSAKKEQTFSHRK